jgi:hypothetical protein
LRRQLPARQQAQLPLEGSIEISRLAGYEKLDTRRMCSKQAFQQTLLLCAAVAVMLLEHQVGSAVEVK